MILRMNPTPPATSLCVTLHTTATIKNKGGVQPLIRSAEKVTAYNLPPLQDLYSSRNLGWAGRTVADLTMHDKFSEKQKPKKKCFFLCPGLTLYTLHQWKVYTPDPMRTLMHIVWTPSCTQQIFFETEHCQLWHIPCYTFMFTVHNVQLLNFNNRHTAHLIFQVFSFHIFSIFLFILLKSPCTIKPRQIPCMWKLIGQLTWLWRAGEDSFTQWSFPATHQKQKPSPGVKHKQCIPSHTHNLSWCKVMICIISFVSLWVH